MSSPSLFWRLQIGGWLGFAVVALPLKVVFFGSVGRAVLATLYREPLGFVLSLGLRWVYRRLQAAGETPAWQLGCWAVAVSTGAGAIDWGAAEILDLSNNLKVPHALGAFGLFWFRSLTYLTWSVFYFWIKGQIAAREQALKLIRIKAAAQESELLMLRAQVNPPRAAAGRPNHIHLDELNDLELRVLREVMHLARDLQQRLEMDWVRD